MCFKDFPEFLRGIGFVEMIAFGLVGHPLSHSLSPKIHEAALDYFDLIGSYTLFDIQPEDRDSLTNVLNRVRKGEIRGINITIPYKRTVIQFMDELSEAAEKIGAVNTVFLKNGTLIGDNTDAAGFSLDLNHFMDTQPFERGFRKNAILLGAGGAARAVAYELLRNGWKVIISARRYRQARALKDNFPGSGSNIEIIDHWNNSTGLDLSQISLIVNATPLGMHPDINSTPWPVGMAFPEEAIVYDLVYNPKETRLVRDARKAGLKATTGLGMLIDQGACAFELWTGKKPPREILRSSLEES